MANFYAFYPPAGSNASVGVNGAIAPTSSTEVGGINPSGDLQPLQTDASGNLKVDLSSSSGAPFHVIVDSSALPTGAATSANQTTEITQLTGIHSDTTSLDGKTVHVDTGNVTIVASALPTGASTAALQTSGNASLTSINANQTNGTQVTQITGTVPLPTGAATAANQVTIITNTGNTATSVASIDTKTPTVGQKTMAASSPVVIASDQSAIPVTGPLTDTQLRATPVPVSGTITASNPSVSLINATAPTSATMIGGDDGTNLRAVKVDAAGVVSVDASGTIINTNLTTIGGAVVAASNGVVTSGTQRVAIASDNSPLAVTQSGSWTVTANAGTNLNTSALALNTTVAALQVAQGSTTSGEQGTLIQGAVTTSAPSYTTAQTSPLSLTTSGALRVSGSTSSPGRALANAPTVTTYGTPVTSAAYVTIIASTTSATNLVEIFDSSGVALFFAIGAAAAEVNQFVIYPGGNGQVPLSIPAGSRISYKAVSTSATGASAYNVLNLYT